VAIGLDVFGKLKEDKQILIKAICMSAMMPVNWISILNLVYKLKCPVHRTSDFGLPSRLKNNIGLPAKKLITIKADFAF
jgi:hypothetical protein